MEIKSVVKKKYLEIRGKIIPIKYLIKNNTKIVENYFFMTILQILNSLFFLLIYPLLIRRLGPDSYGTYVFSVSIVSYFVTLIGFGFDMPAVKYVAQQPENRSAKSHVLSCVFTAKMYLELVSFILFIVVVFSIPLLREKWIILFICFIQTFVDILFPKWYFQGIQKMKIVTYIQVGLKLLSLPFIFLFVKTPGDIWKLAFIYSMSNILGAVCATLIINRAHKIIIKWMPFQDIKIWYKDAMPFFWSSSLNVVKQQTTFVVIGYFFSMSDVALYDLANKIFSVPTTLIASLNSALFPKIILLKNKIIVNRVIKMEFLLGAIIVLSFILLGRYVILIMGGVPMLGAYPLLIALSISIFTPLAVGAILNFIFVPNGGYKYIFYNQMFAFIGFVLFLVVSLLISKAVIVIPLAIAFSAFIELFFCYYMLNKKYDKENIKIHFR